MKCSGCPDPILLNQAKIECSETRKVWHPRCYRSARFSPIAAASLTVKKISLITRKHLADIISFELDLPTSFPNIGATPYVTMTVGSGCGKEYIEKNFPNFPYETIQT